MIADAQMAGRVMKVNHAGEHGAVSIYAGQLFMARITARPLVAELRAFKAHEEGHRLIFHNELVRRGLKRCGSYWLCAVGGYALGVVTGLFGRRAISLTTVAVERVVLRHLHGQLALLAHDTEAAAAISAILVEEQEHHDKASAHHPGEGGLGGLLGFIVAGATEAVIWLGMRL